MPPVDSDPKNSLPSSLRGPRQHKSTSSAITGVSVWNVSYNENNNMHTISDLNNSSNQINLNNYNNDDLKNIINQNNNYIYDDTLNNNH